jgi:hypothetical protein
MPQHEEHSFRLTKRRGGVNEFPGRSLLSGWRLLASGVERLTGPT